MPTPKWQGVFEIWNGGLGIWGGILFGVLAGRDRRPPRGRAARLLHGRGRARAAARQGIGRIGNWWNQELYGKPTKLPWGLKIDDAHHRACGRGVSARVSQRHALPADLPLRAALGSGRLPCSCSGCRAATRFRPPALFALYVSYYCFGRFFEELLRIDPSRHILGLRLNAWVSIVCFVVSTGFFIWWQVLGHGAEPPRDPAAETEAQQRQLPKGPKMAIPRGRVR